MAQIYSIVYQPLDREYGERLDDYIRVPVVEVDLLAGHGIEGDQKAGHHPDRQVNLLSNEWLQTLRPRGYRTAPGEFGEQLVIQGLVQEDLQPGDRLQLGEQACIELTKPRTGCTRLEAAQGQPIAGIDGFVGWLAKVVAGGKIRVGDQVTVLSAEPMEDA